jgi:hypothetical protein
MAYYDWLQMSAVFAPIELRTKYLSYDDIGRFLIDKLEGLSIRINDCSLSEWGIYKVSYFVLDKYISVQFPKDIHSDGDSFNIKIYEDGNYISIISVYLGDHTDNLTKDELLNQIPFVSIEDVRTIKLRLLTE